MLRIKVCGMRDAQNVRDVLDLSIDFMGFIFYEKSLRHVSHFPSEVDFDRNPLDRRIEKVGVFVDADLEFVKDKIRSYQLDYVQLHGRESVFYCESLKKAGVKIIKAFSIDERFRFTNTDFYSFTCDYFLFDTKGKLAGGNGVTFDWDLLNNYDGETPFFLSGGIDVNSVAKIRELKLDKLYGIDINSKFETAPAMKDVDLIRTFIAGVKQPTTILDYYN